MVADAPASELREFAFEKMSRVLGRDRARQLLDELTAELGIAVDTPEDLLALSERMTRLNGFERAVGAMLGVDAVLRGAGGAATSDAPERGGG